MNNSEKKNPVGSVVDVIFGTAELLFGWLSAPTKQAEPDPSVLNLVGLGETQAPELRCGTCKRPIDAEGACYCAANAINTEGHDV